MLIGMAVAYGDGDVFHPISAMSSVRWKVPACWCGFLYSDFIACSRLDEESKIV